MIGSILLEIVRIRVFDILKQLFLGFFHIRNSVIFSFHGNHLSIFRQVVLK